MGVAIALWGYSAKEENELNLKPGDRITVTNLCNSDWYEGVLNGKTAYFPAKFVRVMNELTGAVLYDLVEIVDLKTGQSWGHSV